MDVRKRSCNAYPRLCMSQKNSGRSKIELLSTKVFVRRDHLKSMTIVSIKNMIQKCNPFHTRVHRITEINEYSGNDRLNADPKYREVLTHGMNI